MRTIEWSVEMNIQGANVKGTIEVEDGATEEEIDEAVKDVVFNYVSWGWHEKDQPAS